MGRWSGRRPSSLIRFHAAGDPAAESEPGIELATAARPAESAAPAAWLAPRLMAWGAVEGVPVGSVVPTGFDAYARIAHPTADGESMVGHCPPELRAALIEALAGHTVSERCLVCVWKGWGGVDEVLPKGPRVRLPGREHVLLTMPLDALAHGIVRWAGGELAGPSLWWPEDRAWCVATEIDFRWSYVAGPRACVDAILAHPRIHATETAPERSAE